MMARIEKARFQTVIRRVALEQTKYIFKSAQSMDTRADILAIQKRGMH